MALSWLKQGEDSATMAKQHQAATELKMESKGKMFRFSLKKGEEALITFVDGELNADGYLVPPRFYEHTVFVGDRFQNFVCPEKTAPHSGEKCPICAAGEKVSLVSLFTVIDHRQVPSKDGTKVYKDMPRLFVAKPRTFEMLNKMAIKRGGLAGCTFSVSRSDSQTSAGVGDMFDFDKKTPIDELKAKFMREVTDPKTNVKTNETFFLPADYEKEITFYTASELVGLGFGAPAGGQSMQSSAGDGNTDYSSQL
jgi:hypothetical protein